MNKLIIALAFTLIGVELFAHPWEPEHHVIIDTDCGIDDYRTICMLLSATDIKVLGIITSDGVLDAETGNKKLRSLLSDLHHEGILTGTSSYSQRDKKNCPAAYNFSWGIEQDTSTNSYSAKEMVEYVLNHEDSFIEYICLGSLNTPANLYKESAVFRERIGNIFWSSNIKLNDDNLNYKLDKEGYRYLTEDAQLTLHIISGNEELTYDTSLVSEIKEINNAYSNKIHASLYNNQSPYSKIIFDERVPLYFKNESLFTSDTLSRIIFHSAIATETFNIEKDILQLVEGYSGNQNQVLNFFPLDTSFYQTDVSQIMQSTIEKYGKEEWILGVMTNELHRHLGVYAIIGNKMGIRAREYFGAGIDEVKITSFAGITPPYSCMNDGLQVSTGATLGHGLIKIASDSLKLPEAEFLYMGRTIKISLKEKYRKRIESEIEGYRLVYGLSSDMYWELVRKAALSYWSNWNRHDIFIINTDI